MKIVRCTNGVGVWEVISDNGSSQVFDLKSDAEEYVRGYKKEKEIIGVYHNCWDFADYYEFEEEGHRFHGWECGRCGIHLQTG